MKQIIKPVIMLGLLYLAFALLLSTFAFVRTNRAKADGSSAPPIAANRGAGDRVTLVETRSDAWNARMALLRQADRTLDIVYHSVQADRCGYAFWGEVVRAADRGVKVRVLLDGKVGAPSRNAKRILRAVDAHPLIGCRLYNPAHLLRPWQWHALLHDKFIIADGQHALLGGRNIGDRYYGPAGYNGALVEDRDVLVAGSGGDGSVTHSIQAYMEQLWTSPDTVRCRMGRNTGRAAYAALGDAADRLQARHPDWYALDLQAYEGRMIPARAVTLLHNPVHTARKEPLIGRALQEMVRAATRSVLVQTPYMTGNPAFVHALDSASQRAAVAIQTNSMANTPNCIAFSNYYAHRSRFLQAGATLYEYRGSGSIHGKSVVVDERFSAVGSVNLDDRSMYIDTETMLLIDSPEFAAELTGAIAGLVGQSNGIDRRSPMGRRDAAQEEKVHKGKRAVIQIASVLTRPFEFLL